MTSNVSFSRVALAVAALAALPAAAVPASDSLASASLKPSCAPGGNFDLSKWNLQLPIGKAGSPTTISSSQLQGCDGWQNFD